MASFEKLSEASKKQEADRADRKFEEWKKLPYEERIKRAKRIQDREEKKKSDPRYSPRTDRFS